MRATAGTSSSATSTCHLPRARSSRSWVATARERRHCCVASQVCTRRSRGRSRCGARPPLRVTTCALCPQRPESLLFAETVTAEVEATLKAVGSQAVRRHDAGRSRDRGVARSPSTRSLRRSTIAGRDRVGSRDGCTRVAARRADSRSRPGVEDETRTIPPLLGK